MHLTPHFCSSCSFLLCCLFFPLSSSLSLLPPLLFAVSFLFIFAAHSSLSRFRCLHLLLSSSRSLASSYFFTASSSFLLFAASSFSDLLLSNPPPVLFAAFSFLLLFRCLSLPLTYSLPLFPLRIHTETNTLADGHHGVAPVDEYGPQNDYGVYNMLGNAWEWVADEYRPAPQEVSDILLFPQVVTVSHSYALSFLILTCFCCALCCRYPLFLLVFSRLLGAHVSPFQPFLSHNRFLIVRYLPIIVLPYWDLSLCSVVSARRAPHVEIKRLLCSTTDG